MGSSVVHCGARVGDGQAVKLVNQLLCGVHIAAAAEALAYAESLGLDPRFVFETIRHGAANSFMLEDRGERMLEEEYVPPKSALDIFVKDMGLVGNAAEERGFEAPLAAAALEMYLAGRDAGLGAEDDSGVIRVFRRRMT
jgi:3-hydroxyisobutyrate dehydrogenase/putative dehydrogenase